MASVSHDRLLWIRDKVSNNYAVKMTSSFNDELGRSKVIFQVDKTVNKHTDNMTILLLDSMLSKSHQFSLVDKGHTKSSGASYCVFYAIAVDDKASDVVHKSSRKRVRFEGEPAATMVPTRDSACMQDAEVHVDVEKPLAINDLILTAALEAYPHFEEKSVSSLGSLRLAEDTGRALPGILVDTFSQLVMASLEPLLRKLVDQVSERLVTNRLIPRLSIP
eukprot:TRINITY_DN15569_c0_g1_i1.p1 TRINITY_DN15569_c0_g1~~TRINITY_DN15569_c0_g1_i1.p1  ORF type:complete len:220 (+),score=40.27 TRINITY_DN15569_c0_g1_i1:147-806(+)